MPKRTLHVLYQSDDNYAMVSGISITSLLENNRHLKRIVIHYCGYRVKKVNRLRLTKIVSSYPNAFIEFIDAEPYHRELTGLGVKAWHGVYVTWFKLLAFGDVKVRDSDRLLFINGHTIICGQLDGIIDLDLGDNLMALSYDALINSHKRVIGFSPGDKYYNCGIMLINLKKWQKNKESEKIRASLAERSDYMIADQDFCNLFYKNKIKTLGVEYNFSSAYYSYNLRIFLKFNGLQGGHFYSYDELMSNYYSPKIIHSLYGVQGKPWESGNMHPQRFLWKKYKALTPWRSVRTSEAKRTIAWSLFNTMPQWAFLCIYWVMVSRKFGTLQLSRNKLINPRSNP